jgi:hypothetical protein
MPTPSVRAEPPIVPPLDPPPILPGTDQGNGYAHVILYGRHNEPAPYRVGVPLPVLIHCGGDLYTLSDRMGGAYTYVV